MANRLTELRVRYRVLRSVRIKRKLNRRNVALALGVSMWTVRYWEQGLSTPMPESIKKLEKLLKTPWAKLKQMER